MIDEYSIKYLKSIPKEKAMAILLPYYPNIKDIDDVNKERKEEIPLSDYSCPKCNSRNVIESTAQLRSTDEGSNFIIDCNDCGARNIF
jgi:DNA-directed RNA polymerase subunit M/transcription elongation factor TFIIS